MLEDIELWEKKYKELREQYKELEKELEELRSIKADYIRRSECSNKVLLERGYISKDKIRYIMANNTELNTYWKIKELLDDPEDTGDHIPRID